MTVPVAGVGYQALDARITQISAQLNDLAQSMKLAKQAGNDAALEMFRQQYRELAAQAAAMRATLSQTEAPTELQLKVGAVIDKAVAIGKELGEDVSAVVSGGITLVRFLPYILLAVLLVAAIYFYKRKV